MTAAVRELVEAAKFSLARATGATWTTLPRWFWTRW